MEESPIKSLKSLAAINNFVPSLPDFPKTERIYHISIFSILMLLLIAKSDFSWSGNISPTVCKDVWNSYYFHSLTFKITLEAFLAY